MKPPVELFARGFAAELHRRAAEELFGRTHGQPLSKASAAGKDGAASVPAHPAAAQKAHANAKMAVWRGKRVKLPDPKQMRLRF